MADKTKDIQDIGIVLADDWKLVPVDSRNWELCHRHVGQARGRHEAGTEPRWHRLGRYYQYNTIGEALRYAASVELMGRRKDEAESIWEALREYERILTDFGNALRGLSETHSGPKATTCD